MVKTCFEVAVLVGSSTSGSIHPRTKPRSTSSLTSTCVSTSNPRGGTTLAGPTANAGGCTLSRVPRCGRHRIFDWLDRAVLPDHQLVVIARDDDYTLGVLHSRVHETWTRATGTQLREVESGFRYTPTTTFETFPFPHPTDEQRERVGEAARRLIQLRNGWLSPPNFESADLEKRTLTNLYNQHPTWLANAHAALDAAAVDAYAWPGDLTNEEILERLLALNLERVSA